MRILSVVSTRPELIKMAPVLRELQRRRIDGVFVTTGQHYDAGLFGDFISELGLPEPDENLTVGSGSQAYQTGESLKRLEAAFLKYEPDAVLAQGDTNSVLAAALASQKLLVPFGHVEAGLRSFDRTMPEEINRIMADHCSEILFAPTETSALNLLLENVPKRKVHVTGNTVVDACMQYVKVARKKSRITAGLRDFVVFTCHRKENTTPEKLAAMVRVLAAIRRNVAFTMHPRTAELLKKTGLYGKIERMGHVKLLPPLGYLDFLALMDASRAVVTDSGGLQEEAAVLGKKCVVLRENTERPEAGNVVLAGMDAGRVSRALEDVRVKKAACPFGDGRASERIVSILKKGGFGVESSSFIGSDYPEYALVKADGKRSVAEFEKRGGEVRLLFENGKPRYPNSKCVPRRGDELLIERR
ncbi:UDP-N-acetylglucosamine 2-epimerase [Candidatus Norongarragalina meridionalis]|nr:UDP-N-acetylglucosamine 2-epimerase [Candidatus Norongarragalina meridionalis]